MSGDTRKVCFVIMGFGKKTDYESGRTLDLDATYEAIIKPAVEAQGLRCIRADDIKHSGVIDTPMYEMLLRAELVIADISTGNVNAVYELGVRHALCPNSTILMMEADGHYSFDLNHVSTFKYQHLGADIGAREAATKKRALAELIGAVLDAQIPDSPVYVFLPKLEKPRMTSEQYSDMVDRVEAAQDQLANLVKAGEQALKDSQFIDAVRAFKAAMKIEVDEPYYVQKLALATYKAAQPSKEDALREGLTIIGRLDPENSNDPETLGIAGAMHKRLWPLTNVRLHLDKAISLYRRGFEVRRDYYNGENLAACFDLRAATQVDPVEAQFDRLSARKVRESILELLIGVVASKTFTERSDKKWVYATLANCSFALGRSADGSKYESGFLKEKPAKWEIETYQDGKVAALNVPQS
jgi:hypothetical protein